jgi:DNA-binding CsgD family transcriptional regulator
VARGDALLAPGVARRLLDRFAGVLPGDGTRPADLEELTDREVGVLRFVALALSNAEIASRLVLTEATVRTHVSSVLRKLGLRDRVQAVVFAYDVGLVRPRSSEVGAETPCSRPMSEAARGPSFAEDAGLGDVDLVAPGLAALAMLAWIGAAFAGGYALLRGRDVH